MKTIISLLLLPLLSFARVQGVAYNTTNDTFSPPEAHYSIKTADRMADSSDTWVTLSDGNTMTLFQKVYTTNWVFEIVSALSVYATNDASIVMSGPFTNTMSGAELLIDNPYDVDAGEDVASNDVYSVTFQVRYDDSTWATNGMSIMMTHTNGDFQVFYGLGEVLTNATVYGSYTNFYGTNSVMLSAGYIGTEVITTNEVEFYSYPKTMTYISAMTNDTGYVTNFVFQTGIVTNSFNFYAE